MRKYNYFEDYDVDNSIYDQKTDPYNIAMAVLDKIKHINININFDFKKTEKVAKKGVSAAKSIARQVKDKEHIDIKELELPDIHFSSQDKKRLKIVPFILFVLCIVILVVGVVRSVENENVKLAEFNKSAGTVCVDKLNAYGACNYERLNDDYGDNVNRLTGTCFARQIDFNNDNVSELLVTYNDGGTYYNEVWGFDGKDFITLYKKPACTVSDKTAGSWVTLYRHNNKYYIGTNAIDDGSQVDLYTLKGSEFVCKKDCTYDSVTETFSVGKKADVTSFERIKLSCIKDREAERRVDDFTSVTDNFTSGTVIDAANLAKDETQKMYQAYYALVQEHNQTYGIATQKTTEKTSYLNGLAVVKIVDFNGDGVEELMLVYRKSVGVRNVDSNGNYTSSRENKYFCDIYRWTGEKAVRAFQHEGLSSMSDNGTDTLYILKHDGEKTYYCANTYTVENSGNTVTSTSKIFELDDISFETTFKATKRNSYGSVTRTINGDTVSKSQFAKKQDTVALFLNDNPYNTEIFTVGYVKRKATNQQDVKNQLDETIKEIKKLNKQYVHE